LVFTGTVTERHLEVSADYGGGWRWVISLESDGEERLALTMYNVVPAEYATDEASAGPYPVMVAELRRG
jgi:hypothetical protein